MHAGGVREGGRGVAVQGKGRCGRKFGVLFCLGHPHVCNLHQGLFIALHDLADLETMGRPYLGGGRRHGRRGGGLQGEGKGQYQGQCRECGVLSIASMLG
jgi:hypothetical protein